MINLSQEQVYNFICQMADRGRMVECEEGFAFYIKLTDEWVEKIRHDPSLLSSVAVMKGLLVMDGPNIHFLGIYANDSKKNPKHTAIIKDKLKELIKQENPDGVSWLNRDSTKLIHRRLKCHQQE